MTWESTYLVDLTQPGTAGGQSPPHSSEAGAYLLSWQCLGELAGLASSLSALFASSSCLLLVRRAQESLLLAAEPASRKSGLSRLLTVFILNSFLLLKGP